MLDQARMRIRYSMRDRKNGNRQESVDGHAVQESTKHLCFAVAINQYDPQKSFNGWADSRYLRDGSIKRPSIDLWQDEQQCDSDDSDYGYNRGKYAYHAQRF